jgi:glycerophosphoryl diester phosphodiesterase
MAAFKKALEQGATGIETDVQMTKDGQLVLIHDEGLLRTTGHDALVQEVTLAEVQALDAGSWYSPTYRGEQVPTLVQLFELVKQTGTIINVELKNSIIFYEGLEQKVIECIRQYDMTERVIISSFNHYSLVAFHKLAPEVKTGVLYMEGLYQPWQYAQNLGAQALHAHKEAVTKAWVTEAKAHGIVYYPFTVNDPEEMKKLIAFGVAGIITDYPDRLTELLVTSV